MSIAHRRQRTEELRRIPLTAVLRAYGANRDRADKYKWHTSQGTLSITGAKFINWHRGSGGGGAIDLVIHLEDCPFKEALAWLEHRFSGGYPLGLEVEDEIGIGSQATTSAPRSIIMPEAEPANLSRVRTYLQRERALSQSVIEMLIESGSLYADIHANAVFVLLGKERHIVGAEWRSSRDTRRGMAPGTRKDHGYFSITYGQVTGHDTEDTEHDTQERLAPVILCESAIDAISCAIIHPGNQCLSTAGVRPNPAWLERLVEERRPICCGYDADEAGERVAQAMIAKHPAIQRHRPGHHDWNAELQSRR